MAPSSFVSEVRRAAARLRDATGRLCASGVFGARTVEPPPELQHPAAVDIRRPLEALPETPSSGRVAAHGGEVSRKLRQAHLTPDGHSKPRVPVVEGIQDRIVMMAPRFQKLHVRLGGADMRGVVGGLATKFGA